MVLGRDTFSRKHLFLQLHKNIHEHPDPFSKHQFIAFYITLNSSHRLTLSSAPCVIVSVCCNDAKHASEFINVR